MSKVYEVSIQERVILTTTFRVRVDSEDQLDEEATLNSHIEDSPGYLYDVDKDGEVIPSYFVEVEDIDDEEPVLVDVVEIGEEN